MREAVAFFAHSSDVLWNQSTLLILFHNSGNLRYMRVLSKCTICDARRLTCSKCFADCLSQEHVGRRGQPAESAPDIHGTIAEA